MLLGLDLIHQLSQPITHWCGGRQRTLKVNALLRFTKGFVYRKDWFYIVAVTADLDEKDIYHAVILRWKSGQWANWTIANRIISFCAFDGLAGVATLAMGIDGRIQVGDSAGFRWEMVDTGEEGPSNLRHLTAMRVVGRHVYVAGMARQVYCRPLLGGLWRRADAGALVSKKSLDIEGFKAIDGLNEEDLYAVGFHGQIWHCDGSRWNRLDSPTNTLMVCVQCVTPDLVFLSGSNGTVLKGNKNKWEVIHNGATREDFWGMEYFQGTLYLSTNQGALFKLEQDEIVPVDLSLGKDVSTNWLHANDGVLLSVGAHDLAMFDGTNWTEIAHP